MSKKTKTKKTRKHKRPGPKKKGGRPRKCTKQIIEQAEKYAALDAANSEIAILLGIGTSTFNEWIKKNKKFARAVEKGRQKYTADGFERCLQAQAMPHDEVIEIHELRGRGRNKTMTLVGQRIKKNAVSQTALDRVMKAEKPEKYGDKIEHKGAINIKFNIKKNYADGGSDKT